MACESTIQQPSIQDVKVTVLLTQGPVITYRCFKHSKRTARAIAEPEYTRAVHALAEDGLGRNMEFRLQRTRGACKVFIKSAPTDWPTNSTISREQFHEARSKNCHYDITSGMKGYFREHGQTFVRTALRKLGKVRIPLVQKIGTISVLDRLLLEKSRQNSSKSIGSLLALGKVITQQRIPFSETIKLQQIINFLL